MRATDLRKPQGPATALAVVQTPPAVEKNPFRRLIFEWLDACRADGLSDKTLTDYQEKLFKFWWWWSSHSRYEEKLGAHPSNCTKREAREFAVYLREPLAFRWGDPVRPGKEALSAATIASYGRTVKVFFSWLEREGYIEDSPFDRSVKFSTKYKQDKTIKRVEDEDLERLFNFMLQPDYLSTYDGRRNLAIIALLLDSGIRRGELLSIQVNDLDMDRARVKVSGKTGVRFAMFSDATAEALKAYVLLRDDKGQADPALWLTKEGTPLTAYGFSIMVTRLRNKSGVKFHAHMLRHTFATALASQGIEMFALKELLGHSNIATTQIYVSHNPDKLAKTYSPLSPLKQLQVSKQIKRRPQGGRPRKDRY